jgi:hypothetical protein
MPLTSKTALCNLALAELGARRITSYESTTTVEANACRLHLDHIIDTLLERHQWDFATKRASLSPVIDVPADGEWSNVWQLPGDFVRLIRISSGNPRSPGISFAKEGDHLLTTGGDDTLPIVYVCNTMPITRWSPLFIDAVVYKLAARIAGDVTQNPALADAALSKLESLAMPQAVTADARQSLSGENYDPRHASAQSFLVASRFARSGVPQQLPLPPP